SNLLLDASGQVRILDLGLARLQTSDDDMTTGSHVIGTADYMAPEQAFDSRSVDIRADIYSLGCTLYFLLTGRPPFPRPEYDTPLKKALAHAESPVPPLSNHRTDVPPDVVAALGRMLAKVPGGRFTEPAEAAAALAGRAANTDLTGLLPDAQTPPSKGISHD